MSLSVQYEDLGLRDYKETWDYQDMVFRRIIENKLAPDDKREALPGKLIFVEHPHVYTLGKSGSEDNLLLNYIQLNAANATFYKIDRGGDITYHGPGQLVGYPVFNLEEAGIGLKEYINRIEEIIILSLGEFGVKAGRLGGATGVWLDAGLTGRERKICAIGVRVSRYVTMHGFALNINTDLSYFSHINPCGFTDKGVTSLEKELGRKVDMEEVRRVVKENFGTVFNISWRE